jgi:thioredoxin 1
MTVRTADATTFDEQVLGSGKPVLVDFWADWCPPCRMIAPVLAQIADERADTLSIVQVNYDENPEIGQRYGVLSLPTMLLFRDGEPVRSLVGARPKARLLAELDGALAEV